MSVWLVRGVGGMHKSCRTCMRRGHGLMCTLGASWAEIDNVRDVCIGDRFSKRRFIVLAYVRLFNLIRIVQNSKHEKATVIVASWKIATKLPSDNQLKRAHPLDPVGQKKDK